MWGKASEKDLGEEKEKYKERARQAVNGVGAMQGTASIISWPFFEAFLKFQGINFCLLPRGGHIAASVAEEEHSGSSSLTSMTNCGESRRFISSCFCQRRGREIPISVSFLSRQCVAPPLLLFECLTEAELPSLSGITSFWGPLLFDDHTNLGMSCRHFKKFFFRTYNYNFETPWFDNYTPNIDIQADGIFLTFALETCSLWYFSLYLYVKLLFSHPCSDSLC